MNHGEQPSEREARDGSRTVTVPPAAAPLSRPALTAYGLGIIGYQFPNGAFAALAMPLFNIELGLAPAWIGAILMVGRIWDAVTNPIMGSISDNTRTRWGRRRPYLVLGAALTGLVYPLLWLAPRGWSPAATMTYLTIATLLLFTAFAAYSVPYMALGFELTPDTHERTRVQVWRGYFNLIPTVAMGWLYWLCQRPAFGDTLTGARWLGLAAAVVICVSGVIPGVFLRERYYQLSSRAVRESFWRTARAALANRPFVIVCLVIVTLIVGTQSTDALGLYVLAYYVFGGNTDAAAHLYGWGETGKLVVALGILPLLQWLELRIGKVRTLRWCIWCNLLGAASKWFLISPAHPWTWMIVVALTQAGNIGFWVLVASMKADTCDWDELHSGRRREGIYGAVGNLIQKVAASLVYVLAGVILQLIGFDAALKAAQHPETVYWLRVAFSAVPVLSLVLCLVFLDRYRLTGTVMGDVRRQLEARRSSV